MIKDLDILRPEPSIVILGKEEVDLSFIPNGITFEVDSLLRQINDVAGNVAELINDEDKQKKAFDLSIDLCVLFCSRKHPRLNKEFFLNECVAIQVRVIVDSIRVALNESYKAVEKYGKNLEAGKT
jgi:hypothetical protein